MPRYIHHMCQTEFARLHRCTTWHTFLPSPRQYHLSDMQRMSVQDTHCNIRHYT